MAVDGGQGAVQRLLIMQLDVSPNGFARNPDRDLIAGIAGVCGGSKPPPEVFRGDDGLQLTQNLLPNVEVRHRVIAEPELLLGGLGDVTWRTRLILIRVGIGVGRVSRVAGVGRVGRFARREIVDVECAFVRRVVIE